LHSCQTQQAQLAALFAHHPDFNNPGQGNSQRLLLRLVIRHSAEETPQLGFPSPPCTQTYTLSARGWLQLHLDPNFFTVISDSGFLRTVNLFVILESTPWDSVGGASDSCLQACQGDTPLPVILLSCGCSFATAFVVPLVARDPSFCSAGCRCHLPYLFFPDITALQAWLWRIAVANGRWWSSRQLCFPNGRPRREY